MVGLYKYLFKSENKDIYRSIARQYQSNPLRVYKLAHGKKAKCNKDYQILKQLRKEEIIEGVLNVV
ncbi:MULTISPECIES: hypothetical protein [Proteiniphilum]|jgi:hypothetical protein|uniref:hypothetical protein n=1 Tax=Proteiniphilum TaxID=294702 RepID=UPI001EE9E37C|nr:MULTISPECIES: hypothetical protein [Proteiniphilum]MDD2246911.1 hypothetical protein [Proteiniphilum sp.]MDD3909600.1 hypothetical protein [Proteiniphilum sp.]MDD4416666.1 hypothetical protein [Proteiniphilum sp.]ULB33553.1 hypothetical protein KDN43_11070 [Proteiniphilum propionicum]